ncbi:AraC family transcriptional regulator [Leucobacter zeae]|nr:AraC family transcriptional regulator [Leucobacter zeae]
MSSYGQRSDPGLESSASDPEEQPIALSGISTGFFAVRDGEEWGWHRHDADELLWGTRGALVVDTEAGSHAVPWAVGLWIPAGAAHRVRAERGTEFACTFLARGIGEPPRADVGAVGIPASVRVLLDELSRVDLDAETRRLAERLIPRLLDRSESLRLVLEMPQDDRARRVAEGVVGDPSDARTLREWGAAVGASERNLARLFRRETGVTFAEWRLKARMLAATELLAAGQPVGAVSRRVGYATPSAFVQAFRREVGGTPGSMSGALGAHLRDSSV